MPKTLRSPETQAKYAKALENLDRSVCRMCAKEPIKQFLHWKIVENSYPYDLIAKVHHMLIPLRHVKEQELTDEETEELKHIKAKHLSAHYNHILEALGPHRSFPEHFHLHLIVGKG